MNGPSTLTPQQLRILQLIAEGNSNAAIGRRVHLSEDTVKAHIRRLFHKLGAQDRAHAVAIGAWTSLPVQSATAVTLGLVKPIPCDVCSGRPSTQEAPAPLDGRLTDADDYGRDYDAQAHALGLPEVGEAGEPQAGSTRPHCRVCDMPLCEVSAADPCFGCCSCVGSCLGAAEPAPGPEGGDHG